MFHSRKLSYRCVRQIEFVSSLASSNITTSFGNSRTSRNCYWHAKAIKVSYGANFRKKLSYRRMIHSSDLKPRISYLFFPRRNRETSEWKRSTSRVSVTFAYDIISRIRNSEPLLPCRHKDVDKIFISQTSEFFPFLKFFDNQQIRTEKFRNNDAAISVSSARHYGTSNKNVVSRMDNKWRWCHWRKYSEIVSDRQYYQYLSLKTSSVLKLYQFFKMCSAFSPTILLHNSLFCAYFK